MSLAISSLLFLVVLYLVIAIAVRLVFFRGRGSLVAAVQIPKMQAHRGYHLEGVRENTLESLKTAAQKNSTMTEFDVQVSRDGVVVLFHDADLQRLHNDSRSVAQTKSADLQALGVSTLEEVLLSSETPNKMNIELKTSQIFCSKLERAIIRLLRKTKHQKTILFSSFNPFSLMKISVLAPEYPRALLACEEKLAWNKFFLRKLWLLPFCRADLLHLDQKMIRPEHVKLCRKRDLVLVAWTVNEKKQYDRLEQIGVQFFISDRTPNYFMELEALERKNPVRLI